MKNGLKQYPANLLYWGGPQSVKSGRGFRPLLFDRFLTDRSAGAINGTAAEPGGSDAPTRVVSDTGGKATISGDEFKVASGASANTPTLVYGPLARVTGQVLAAKVHAPDNGNALFGWSSTSNGTTQTAQFYCNLYELKTTDGFSQLARLTQDAPLWLIIVQRAAGYMYFAFGGAIGGLSLLHINRSGTTASLYAAYVHYTSSVHHAVTDVVVDSALYIPTALVSGLLVSGTINVSESGKTDHLTIAGLTRTAGEIGMVTRYTDANNYVRIYHDGTNVKIDKVVAGAVTNVASVAKTYSAGADLEAIWYGTNLRVLYNASALNANGYTISEAALQTGTQVGVYSTNVGNSVTNFECFPRGTGGEHAALKKAVVRPQSKPVILCDGDSLTAGSGIAQTETYPYQLANTLGRDAYDLYNLGVGGQTIVDMLADLSNQITPHYGVWNGHTVVIWGGTNDLASGATAAATYAVLESYVNTLLAVGFRVKVLTMIKRGTGGALETKRQDYNALINANTGWSVIDVGALAEFQDVTNATYYQPDQTHITAAGATVIANAVSNNI